MMRTLIAMTPTRFIPHPLAPALLLLAACLGGCQTTRMTESTTLDVAGPIAIDVETFGGDVTIHAGEKGSAVTVDFERLALHGDPRNDEAAASLEQITTTATIVPGDLGQTLQVRAETAHPEPHFQRVNITITAPAVDGVRIITRDGSVDVREVSGECTLQTSAGFARLVTRQPLTRPVSITNRDGPIDLRMTGDSRGVIDARAEDGSVVHRVRLGTLTIGGDTGPGVLQATLNNGDNPITLRTVNDDIRIAVVANPEAFGIIIFEP